MKQNFSPVFAQDHFFLVSAQNEYIVHESECSIKCKERNGVVTGNKTVTIVQCDKTNINQNTFDCKIDENNLKQKNVSCQPKIECPAKCTYGKWGQYTQCSRTCIRNVDEVSTKTRKRCVRDHQNIT